jgi:LuxR family transcriptional regulator, maltose regulon positive regulatory protein
MTYGAYISKINPPKVLGIVARPRVFAYLDLCRESDVTWVCGPAGSGKTALVASYLEGRRQSCVWYKMDAGDADPATFFFCLGRAFQNFLPADANPFPVLSPEYLHGLDAFAGRFFEQILAFPEAPKLIIIDNYHEVPPNAEIHAVLSKSFASLPAGVTVVVISRELPNAKYARLRANKLLSILKPDLLKFSVEEAQSVIAALAPECSAELSALFHKHTMGWAAGLILMAEHHRLTGGVEVLPDVSTPQEILDYFASELFEQAAAVHQDFLLRTSAFNEMTADMARELTGLEGSEQILSSLNRKHFFTEVYLNGSPVFLYHPLFLEFLRSRAHSFFGAAGFRDIKRSAALIAEQHGLEDAAADLYVASEDWRGLTALLEQMAVNVMAQGRSKQLIEWLDQVPQEDLDRHPRLLYWLGIAELSLAHCSKARARFELALSLSDALGDADGVYLAWSALVDSHFFEMKDWHPLDQLILSFDDFQGRYPTIPSAATGLRVALSGFTAHVLRESPQAVIDDWRHRLDALLPLTELATRLQAGLIKSLHCIWRGDYHRNRLLLDQLCEEVRRAATPPPLPVLTLRMLEAMHFWLTAEPESCRTAVCEGVALANSSGVFVWNHHYQSCSVEIALIEGEYGEARSLLRDMGHDFSGASSLDKFYYHVLSAWTDFLQDDTASALSHLEVGHGPTMTIGARIYEGIWCLAMAQVKLRRKVYDEAPRFLERALAISQQINSKNLEFLCLIYQAQLLTELGQPGAALLALRSGMALGSDQNYRHFLWWIPSTVADMCALALRHGIEPEYARDLIRRRNLFPAVAPVDVEEWPWEITIHCLGKLEIRVQGVLVKIQKKPLELLKCIIALGGSDVKYERIADLIWPDAEGDTGLGNFKITLHRLRQLLGENALLYKDGKLSLDTRRVWLDVWAFERTALKASAQWCRAGDQQVTMELTERAMALYGGQFVKDDQEQGWLYQPREKLSRSYVAVVSFLGGRCLSSGDFERAIGVYERGVEVEPLAEILCEGLITAYSRAGYLANAIQTYRRYEGALRTNFGVQPARRLAQLISGAEV